MPDRKKHGEDQPKPEPTEGREKLKEVQEAIHSRGAGHLELDRPEECECPRSKDRAKPA